MTERFIVATGLTCAFFFVFDSGRSWKAPWIVRLSLFLGLAWFSLGWTVSVVSFPEVFPLELAASLHPSAAVGGTPTSVAIALIAEIEGMDRGRYAGPVGWMDANGDGEWGLALR